MRYRNTNTGEVFSLNEIQKAYDMFRYDMENDYGCFDNWFDKMCQNGEYEEVDEPDLLGNRELIQKLYDHIGHDMDGIENDIKFDFLTQNEGRDGKQYLWYMDSGMMAIIDEDGNISEDHDKIDELFC